MEQLAAAGMASRLAPLHEALAMLEGMLPPGSAPPTAPAPAPVSLGSVPSGPAVPAAHGPRDADSSHVNVNGTTAHQPPEDQGPFRPSRTFPVRPDAPAQHAADTRSVDVLTPDPPDASRRDGAHRTAMPGVASIRDTHGTTYAAVKFGFDVFRSRLFLFSLVFSCSSLIR